MRLINHNADKSPFFILSSYVRSFQADLGRDVVTGALKNKTQKETSYLLLSIPNIVVLRFKSKTKRNVIFFLITQKDIDQSIIYYN